MNDALQKHPAVHFRGVSKQFGPVVALDDVSFDVAVGSLHAILGENGAGKSTLMKILVGIYKADRGQVFRSGEATDFMGPKQALASGVGMLFQNSTLIRSLTIGENLALTSDRGVAVARGGSWIGFDLRKPVAELSRAERQLVEVYRLLARGADVLVLDEPTASLTPIEANALFDRLCALKSEGKTILLVTHKLHEVEANADAVTVLRNGRHVQTVPKGAATVPELARWMVGAPQATAETASSPRRGRLEAGASHEPVLSVHGVALRAGGPGRDAIDFEVHRGECVGVAGVAGNGQTELIDALVGRVSEGAGKVTVFGRPIRAADRHTFAFVPDNAAEIAVAADLSVRDNVMLNDIAVAHKASGDWTDRSNLDKRAKDRLERFRVKYASLSAPAATLSGGNLHKLILAREFANDPTLAIVVNPTAGLDINATQEVRAHLAEIKQRGCAIVLVSNELDEILELSDRILVLSGRRAVADMRREDASLARVGELMGGHVAGAVS